ncbi:MAG: serine/threonine-protein kinase [Planctomycetota bacterium]
MEPHKEKAPQQKGDTADELMAKLLAEGLQGLRGTRLRLAKEATDDDDAADLLGRLNALEFVDSLVGEGIEIPERLGEYQIKGVLGSGGMGTVYRAYQESLEREVALKVLAPKFGSNLTMRKRFRSEARASAAMHHQHIVPIYDYGEAQGHLYFAMELVPGVSLDRHISSMQRHHRGFLEPLDAARRFAGVADALALAHKRQILHRDVKPGNIMVHRDGTLALMDFGISKFLDRPSMNLTSVGGFLGTLYYSPPEQAAGKDLTPASDLYSLGVAIFETITGELPLSGDSTEALLHSLLHEEPRRLRQVSPKAPRDLEAVLEKLLHKDPRDRYADGEALGMDLRRVAEGEPVRIRRQTWLGRAWRRAKRHPVQSAALATAAVLLLVSLLFMKGWISNLTQRIALDGQRQLREAYNSALKEPGPAFGPQNVLSALTGTVSEASWQTEFREHLDQAKKNLPGSDQPGHYEDAYFHDPEPAATALLLAGKGLSASRALDKRILQESPESADFQMDEVAWLRLYPLYLGRAMAALTATVSDIDQARADLQLAAFVRPGSFLPRMLRVFLSWRPMDGADALITPLSELLNAPGLPQNSRRAAAEMLLAFAGVAPPTGSHLMRFPMDYPVRKRLHETGRQWLGDAALTARPGAGHGLEVVLARCAAQGLQHISDRPRLDKALKDGRDLLDNEIAKTSPLQSWAVTFALIADEQPTGSVAQQLLGAIHLLELNPDAAWLGTKKEALDLVTKALAVPGVNPGADAVRIQRAKQLQALLDQRLGTPEEFAKSAAAWAEAEPYNPDALLCAFHSQVSSQPLGQDSRKRLQIEGVVVIQAAADPDATRVRLMRVLREEIQKSVDQKQQNIKELLKSFERPGS